MAIGDVFNTLTAVAEGAIGQMGQWIDAIFAEPILIVAFMLPIVGLGIGLLKRLLSTHA